MNVIRNKPKPKPLRIGKPKTAKVIAINIINIDNIDNNRSYISNLG